MNLAIRLVHPRRCGERIGREQRFRTPSGSSPQVRGTPIETTDALGNTRFIPAGAGNAGRQLVLLELFHGSSPQVRGTRDSVASVEELMRFIPAGAGNATTYQACYAPLTVHPRRCGERYEHLQPLPVADGSSPQVRGTHLFAFAFSAL